MSNPQENEIKPIEGFYSVRTGEEEKTLVFLYSYETNLPTADAEQKVLDFSYENTSEYRSPHDCSGKWIEANRSCREHTGFTFVVTIRMIVDC
jgi:hypothetical protein